MLKISYILNLKEKYSHKSRQEPSKSENDVLTDREDLNGSGGVYVVLVW